MSESYLAIGHFEGNEGWMRAPFYGEKTHHATVIRKTDYFIIETRCGARLKTKHAPLVGGNFPRCKKCEMAVSDE